MKNVLITGASSGIGREIAKKLSKRFDNIILHGRNIKRLKDVSGHVENNGCNSDIKTADLSDEKEVLDFVNEIKNSYKKLDSIVIDAGLYTEGDLMNTDFDRLKKDFNVNFFSGWLILKELLSLLEKGETKRIFIIGSTAAYEPYPLVPEYGVQKYALKGFAKNLRKELMEKEIGVCFVSPGGTWTGMWEGEDLPKNRLLESKDVAVMIDASFDMSKQAVLEEIKIVPMLGDIHEE